MDWLRRLFHLGKSCLISEPVIKVAQYSYQTILYTLDHVQAVPKAVWSMQSASGKVITRHMWRMVYDDLMPAVAVGYASHLLQQYGNDYADERRVSQDDNLQFVLQASMQLLAAATKMYQFKRYTRFTIRAAVLTLETPSLLNGMRQSRPLNICQDERCSSARFVQGAVRDIVAYYAAEATISMVRHVPIVGHPLAAILSVYHRGGYLLAVALPGVCNRHQVAYLQAHSSLVLALGLEQAGGTFLATQLIERVTGMPAVWYANGVDQLVFIASMMLTAHALLPPVKPVKKSVSFDPVLSFQCGVGVVFDVITLGIKEKISRNPRGNVLERLKEQLWKLPWIEGQRFISRVYRHRVSRMVLPELLHDFSSFVNDPVIYMHWQALQEQLVGVLSMLESRSQSLDVMLLCKIPGTAGVAGVFVRYLFGVPEFITRLGLQLVADKDAMQWVSQCRRAIEALPRTRDSLPVPSVPQAILEQQMLNPRGMRVIPDYMRQPASSSVTMSDELCEEEDSCEKDGWVHL